MTKINFQFLTAFSVYYSMFHPQKQVRHSIIGPTCIVTEAYTHGLHHSFEGACVKAWCDIQFFFLYSYFTLKHKVQNSNLVSALKPGVIKWWFVQALQELLPALKTHICRVDPSIHINWTSPFPILRLSGVLFHFYSISNRYSCKQTVKTLIRHRVLRRLIWVCTVCLYPKNGTLGLYGLIKGWVITRTIRSSSLPSLPSNITEYSDISSVPSTLESAGLLLARTSSCMSSSRENLSGVCDQVRPKPACSATETS